MNRKINLKYALPAAICGLFIVGLLAYYFFSSFSNSKETQYLYIDQDDTIDSVFTKLSPMAERHAMNGFTTLVRHSSYAENIHTGRYAISPGDCAISIFRRLKNAQQAPLNLTIPSVRTNDRLAAEIGRKLMLDSAEIAQALYDSAVCKRYGYDTATIACMFIPNTYEMYWNVGLDKFLDRMQQESERFWNDERQAKADEMGLSRNQVITLASIIDEETADNDEKPMIAGMYLNRLWLHNAAYPNGMPLQADPTIKFAWKQFELRRIYNKLLTIDSPYNTYRNTGLPPGPIRIPTVAGIDAVLNYAHHDYLYMCAKEDFSGTHNFAATYAEHLQNAARYTKALNNRGIR
ncbi:MAG: endolytic transglycosylase MltG [Prevotella sp.]|nr:endolytic transglycosylase MltG [Prevotella sp.]